MTKTVRYENATVFQGLGLPLLGSITIRGDNVAAPTETPDEIVDCAGVAILPAFGDAHCHPLLAARGSLGPRLENCESIESIRLTVRDWAERNSSADWIIGGFYDRDLAPEGRFDRRWLDDLCDRPIVLQAADQHAIWANTKALEAAGFFSGGSMPFGVDLDGTLPLGTLREDAKQRLLDFAPQVPPATLARAIEGQLDYLASLGIVFALDAWVDQSGLEAYLLVEHPVRVSSALWVTPETDCSAIPANQSVKLFADGVIGSATAMVREPFECSTTHPHGVSSWQRSDFESKVRELANGVRDVYIHAIGDAAIDWVISAANGKKRIHIEHAEMLTADQIEKVVQLDIKVCFQPLWARPDAMMRNAEKNLGLARASKMYPMALLEKSQGSFVFGSDWPVSSADPLLGIYTAVTRTEPNSSQVHNAENRISVERAISAYTTGDTGFKLEKSTAPIREPRNLTPGNRADLVVLTGNPFNEPGLWAEVQVAKTISGGQTIFTRH